jgi:hypothetical protein
VSSHGALEGVNEWKEKSLKFLKSLKCFLILTT